MLRENFSNYLKEQFGTAKFTVIDQWENEIRTRCLCPLRIYCLMQSTRCRIAPVFLTRIGTGRRLGMSYPPKLMQKLLVFANLGRVRFLVFKQSGDDPLEQAHLLEAPGSPCEVRKASIHQTVTDQAGRFSQGGASAHGVGMSYGDEYELEERLEVEALKRVASKIDEIIFVAGYPGWHLVAPSTILSKLQEALSEPTRRCLSGSEAGDLTKIPLADLEKRFL